MGQPHVLYMIEFDTVVPIKKTFCPISRWDNLISLAAQQRVTLEEALNRSRCFHDNWKKEADWLTEAERQTNADWSPHALPQTCDTDLEQHKVLYCTSTYIQ